LGLLETLDTGVTFLLVLAAAGLTPALGGAFLAAFTGAGLAFNFLTADMLFRLRPEQRSFLYQNKPKDARNPDKFPAAALSDL
jgi:hypothetical protein